MPLTCPALDMVVLSSPATTVLCQVIATFLQRSVRRDAERLAHLTVRIPRSSAPPDFDAARAEAYGKVLAKVHDAAVWLPLIHEPRTVVSSTRLAPIVPHSNYGAALYKGLDLKLVE